MSSSQQRHERVVVVGAGPCGLAIARQLLHEQNLRPLVLDRASAPASMWRSRYEGFRLNTCGYWSHLPGQPIPRRYGRWPKRDDMITYFNSYVRRQQIPLALVVVVTTGNYHTPALPAWPGMDGYTRAVLHSADYRNPWPFVRRDVLVVGSGNSATDIALQLSDGVAARVRMAVREPPHLVPRSAAGIPVDTFSVAFHRLPVPHRGIYRALLDDGSIPHPWRRTGPANRGGADRGGRRGGVVRRRRCRAGRRADHPPGGGHRRDRLPARPRTARRASRRARRLARISRTSSLSADSYTMSASARPAARPEKMQPPRNAPSSAL